MKLATCRIQRYFVGNGILPRCPRYPPKAEPLWSSLMKSQCSDLGGKIATPPNAHVGSCLPWWIARFEWGACADCSTEGHRLYNTCLFGKGVEVMSQKHQGQVWVVRGLPTRLPVQGFNSHIDREHNCGLFTNYTNDSMGFWKFCHSVNRWGKRG